MPWLPAAGVPARVAVPLPLSVKVTPDGRAGLLVGRERGRGDPVVVTENVPAVPGGEGRRAGAGDDRGRRGRVHGQREALGRVRADPVGRGDRDRVAAARSRRRGAGQGGRPVAVVDEGDAGRAAHRDSVSAAAGLPVVVTVNDPGGARR